MLCLFLFLSKQKKKKMKGLSLILKKVQHLLGAPMLRTLIDANLYRPIKAMDSSSAFTSSNQLDFHHSDFAITCPYDSTGVLQSLISSSFRQRFVHGDLLVKFKKMQSPFYLFIYLVLNRKKHGMIHKDPHPMSLQGLEIRKDQHLTNS